MQVFENITKMQEWAREQKKQGQSIGLVPTMGYLHEGHLALVKEARQHCDRIVVSIFVNPIQFGVGEDFEQYPRDLEQDSALLEKEKVDALFCPGIRDMYPGGFQTFVEAYGEITEKMCGASRPGHFKGVTTVVSKLFNICQPDRAYFGQKDAQQLMVVEKMVRELNFPLEIIRVPIVREKDGLAMSSRNVYLSPEERAEALVLYRALKMAEEEIKNGERETGIIRQKMEEMIRACPRAAIDYIAISNANDLSEMQTCAGKVLIALAIKFGKTRLIDNLIVEV
ncbi:MAG: pantoate--beta-alanine ligase [Syntrophomonas sp.]|uniref:pantoate--beta-alanine ligase n=1 Tax=Syntrophomonas sp. TaxID=2053627 RepID=UPI002622B03F|nr:pantoate--beta-alanine ligase [Syntrophomonas sp.]MDD2510445.1 pantoate--beta-alanine ligase [Syntrophomonas sp.]MDD3879748.1 pantoate--beta-alanine ligase [Syntrophomonas sp.]MDD4626701.1 pantoate--beta-alanine ligase [Syntrophomonas sp.]